MSGMFRKPDASVMVQKAPDYRASVEKILTTRNRESGSY